MQNKAIRLIVPAALHAQVLRRENAQAACEVRRASVTAWIIDAIKEKLARPDAGRGE